MRKFVFSIVLLFFIIFVIPVSADHKKDVLGETTGIMPQISPTSDGPGLILPDSPLYFLDHFKQNLRLMFAVTPEAKAQIHSDIAGERLAELRFMLAKNNQDGIDKALSGVSDNLEKAVADLAAAKLTGKDVAKLAQSINIDIKEKRESLDALSESDDREMMFKAKSIQEKLLKAKLDVEDSLPAQDLENELEDNIENELEDGIEEASSSARGLQHAISVLNRLASQAAERNQTRREEALRHAIEVKNDALQKQLEKLLDDEATQEAQLLEAQKDATRHAEKAAIETQKAATEFRKAKNKLEEIKSNSSQKRENPGKSEENKKSRPSGYLFELFRFFLKSLT